jgi:hypothetical protein
MSERIPQELVDMIIDHLHNNRKALSTCSLVCGAWLSSSRFHKFEKIILHLKPTRGFDPTHFSTAVPYIQRLHILCNEFDFIPDISKCAAVRSLSLEHVVLPIHRKFLRCFPFSMLDTLQLRGCRVGSASHLIQLLHNFPRLNSFAIYLETNQWSSDSDTPPEAATLVYHPPFAGDLDLRDTRSSCVRIIPSFPGGVRFRTIKICDSWPSIEFTALQDTINMCGEHLLNLELDDFSATAASEHRYPVQPPRFLTC